MRCVNSKLTALVISLVLASAASSAGARDEDNITSLSLDDLMQVEVTSVAKKPQLLANAAAAVFVITAEDIRRSGATSLPEALRLAPGVDATRVSGNRWAVSIRGFAERLANKLLVLVDGRNVYNPAFSGVVWEDLQFPLEDIKRIEVIRGPGAAVWGTNAVNGVINIITKSAAATQGKLAVVRTGNVEGNYGLVRWGGSDEDGDRFYRVYVSAQNAESQQAFDGGDGQDAYRNRSAGFRLDGYGVNGAHWDVSGDMFDMDGGVNLSFQLPDVASSISNERHRGASLRARFEKNLADGSNLQVQGAYAYSDIEASSLGSDQRDTFDLDIQHRLRLGERHDVVWGGNYRLTRDNLSPSPYFFLNEPSMDLNYYSLFAQDEIGLTDDLHLTLGLRLDHNEFTGWESQPTARLSWNVQPNHALWMAASRAARAPSRGEIGFNANNIGALAPLPPPYPPKVVPYITRLYSTSDYGSEALQAYELGWRSQWSTGLFTDWVAFSHRYRRLRSEGEATFVPRPSLLDPSYIDVYVPLVNGGEMTLNGIELAVDWRPINILRFQLAQTWNGVAHVGAGAADVDAARLIPRRITSLLTSWTPRPDVSVNLWYRYMSERPSSAENPQHARRAFDSVDLRLAWKPRKDWELSLVGQNLNDGVCDAYSGLSVAWDYSRTVPTCTPRSVYGQARWDF